MFNLDNKLAVVTGGASGIGASIASNLASAGATVIIADINIHNAEIEATNLRAKGCSASAIYVDLADEMSIVECCNAIVGTHGTPWLLVNNAGLQDRQLLLEGTAEEWDRMNRINGRAAFLMTREVANAMVAAGNGGRVVNIASLALRGSIVLGLACYAGSKGALLGLSHASAFELAEHNITVNAVLPGGVKTPGALAAKGPPADGPGRRSPPLGMCDGNDIAAAVLFFATPAARRVTNQALAVDGGFSVS